MRADGHSLAPLLAGLARWRVVLLYGTDDELVRTRARDLAQHESGDPDDPFAVSECEADRPEAIRSALLSPTPTGHRRVVRVRSATDRLVPVVESVLQQPVSALLVLQSGALLARSRLREVVERSEAGCAVGCPLRDAHSDQAIRAVLDESGVRADADAVAVLVRHAREHSESAAALGAKAAFFAGPRGRLSRSDALLLTFAGGGVLEAGVSAGLGGNAVVLDASLNQAFGEGLAAVAVVLRALRVVQALRAPDRPGRDSVSDAASRAPWTGARLDTAAATLARAERITKSTGSPAELIAWSAVQNLADLA